MSERTNVESQLASKYRQPKGVEQFGIEPVPESLKTVKWYDLFMIIVNLLLNPGIILIAGLAVVAGLSFWAAVTAEVLGIFIAFVAYIVMATIGVDYGLPGIVSTRMAFGVRGSQWTVSVLRTISSVYWFAFQTLAGALGIIAVLNAWFGIKFSLIAVSLVFAVLQVTVALFGYEYVKHLSRVAFPLKIVILGYLLYLLMTHSNPDYAPGAVFSFSGDVGWKWAVFALWTNSVAAAWFSQVTDAADYCRYSNSRADMWIGTMAAALIGTLGAAFLGAYAASATLGQVSNPFEVITGVTTSGITLFLVLVVLVLDNWTINVLNIYTGGLSLANLLSGLGRFWATLLVAAAGVALSVFPSLVNGYTGFMTIMGNFYAPIVGVIIADYVFLKRSRIDVLALFERNGPYWYVGGFNPIALAWMIGGFLIYLALPVSALPTLTVAIIVGVAYYATMRLSASKLPWIGAAARPGEQRKEISAATVTSIT